MQIIVLGYVNDGVSIKMLMVGYKCVTKTINAELQEDHGVYFNLHQQ